MMNNADMPASPSKSVSNTGSPYYNALLSDGLTKREHFAGMVIQGICANRDYITEDWKEIIAKEAVYMADALLAELEKAQ
jgi:hypothetical protein